MRARFILLLLLALAVALPASADQEGRATFAQKCARCHVVGQGQALTEKHKSFVDITLAAQRHDEKWINAFLQKPYAVDPQTACRAALDAAAAHHVYHFLKDRLRPRAATAAAARSTAAATLATQPGAVPPALPMKVAPPPEPPKPQGLVNR